MSGQEGYFRIVGRPANYELNNFEVDYLHTSPNTAVVIGRTGKDHKVISGKIRLSLGSNEVCPSVSREHLQIQWNQDTQKWSCIVKGKNGISIFGKKKEKGARVDLVMTGYTPIKVGADTGYFMLYFLPPKAEKPVT